MDWPDHRKELTLYVSLLWGEGHLPLSYSFSSDLSDLPEWDIISINCIIVNLQERENFSRNNVGT